MISGRACPEPEVNIHVDVKYSINTNPANGQEKNGTTKHANWLQNQLLYLSHKHSFIRVTWSEFYSFIRAAWLHIS